MKKSKILLLSALFILSCKLDYPLQDKITDPNAIDTLQSARELLNMAYHNSFKNFAALIFVGDDVQPNEIVKNINSDYKLYLWNPLDIAQQADEVWAKSYQAVSNLNVLLARMDRINILNSEALQEQNSIKAEALSLKAWNYYILLRLFSPEFVNSADADGIVLKNTEKPELKGRSTVNQSYNEIINLCDQALQLLPDLQQQHNRPNFINRGTILALKMEVVMATQNWKAALTISRELFGKYRLDKSDYLKIWNTNTITNGELIFSFANQIPVWQRFEYQNTIINTTYSAYDASEEVVYEPDDVRLVTSYLTNQGAALQPIGKYRSTLADIKPYDLLIFRTSRIVLQAAEANYQINNTSQALYDLNQLRNARGVQSLNLSRSELLEAIKLESRKEFLGEWQRYLDLKRWGSPIKRFNYTDKSYTIILPDDYRWIWPLPQAEVQQSNGKIQQNKGWI